jgi:hypothetical protein
MKPTPFWRQGQTMKKMRIHGSNGVMRRQVLWAVWVIVALLVLLSVEPRRAEADLAVRAWGWDDRGQLGNGLPFSDSTTPSTVPLTCPAAVATGAEHSLALRDDGTVWAWGENGDISRRGLLGTGDTINVAINTPSQVRGLTGAIAVTAGQSHSLTMTSATRSLADELRIRLLCGEWQWRPTYQILR